MVNHVTLWFQRENGLFASFDTIECVEPCYYDENHLKIVLIIATIFDPGLNSPGEESSASCNGLQWLERVADCNKVHEHVARLIYLHLHEIFSAFHC